MTGAVGTTDTTAESQDEKPIGYIPGEEPDEEVGDAQSPDEAAASFAKGFESAGGEQTLGSHLRPGDRPVADTPAEQDAPGETVEGAKATANAELDDVRKRMRRLEGRVGTLNSDLSAVKAERDELKKKLDQGGQSAKERAETLKHLKEIDESIQEFREIAPIKKELENVYEKLGALEQQVQWGSSERLPVDVSRQVGEELLGYLHSDWQEVATTEEFRGFVLKGGPSQQEYAQYARLIADDKSPGYQARVEEANAIIEGWAEDFPDWWDDRGRGMFKGDPRDSIELLDRFKDARESSQARRESVASQQQSMQARLRRSAPTRGVDTNPVTGVSDEEAFSRGFKKASRHHNR